jgi:hypothetical protein
MHTKLTLTIEKSIIVKAKKYASKKGCSLSDIIENYLKAITAEDNNEKIEQTPIVKSLKGSLIDPKKIRLQEKTCKKTY